VQKISFQEGDDMNLNKLLEKMWINYCQMNPGAKKIYDLFSAEGETVLTDHIALRTFNHPKLGIKSLAQVFLDFGYQEKNSYLFKNKHLFAKHYEHRDETMPKIFISELELEKVSPFIHTTVDKMVSEIPSSVYSSLDFSVSGRQWNMSQFTYEKLAKESEYASWVAALGFRPNHFTVNVNNLKNFTSIESVNEFLISKGIKLNSSGGLIKGNPQEFLEQSSTMASEIPVQFTEGTFNIPGCYYEFALRYKMASGKYYQGFVAASADKIFESTNRV
jgi:hypothetical protein